MQDQLFKYIKKTVHQTITDSANVIFLFCAFKPEEERKKAVEKKLNTVQLYITLLYIIMGGLVLHY